MDDPTVAALEELGLTDLQVEAVELMLETAAQERAVPYAAEFLRRVFLRVDVDSAHGRALARALGFTNDTSLARAAEAFCVSKQYLGRIQDEVRVRIGDLAEIRGSFRPTFSPQELSQSSVRERDPRRKLG